MKDRRIIGRRDLLRISGGAAVTGTVGLAGCLGGDGGDGGDGGSDGGGSDGGDGMSDGGDGGSDGGDGGDGGSDGGDGGSDFPTEDITWVVPYSAGGGFDLIARAYSEMWPQHMSNDVNVVVENRTGGGGLTGATYVSQAEPNGYTIGWMNIPGFVVSQIAGDAEFDLREMSWIARIAEYRFAVVVAPDSEFQSPDDWMNAGRPISIASTGRASTAYVFAEILSERMGFEVDHVIGYEGAAEARTAVRRGDVEAYISNSVHALPMVEDGNLDYLFMISPEPLPFAPDVPTVVDMGFEDAYQDIGIHFSIAGPPGIDEEVVTALDESLRTTTESDEFMQWAEEADQAVAINYAGSEETAEIVSGILDTYMQFEDLFT